MDGDDYYYHIYFIAGWNDISSIRRHENLSIAYIRVGVKYCLLLRIDIEIESSGIANSTYGAASHSL